MKSLRLMLERLGIAVSSEQLVQFQIHFELLLRWNAKTNLTAIREPEEILRRHFVESAYLTKVMPLGPGTLVDIGSGGGFPGVPAIILSPVTRVILIESVTKKAAFLKEVARALALPGLEVHAGRVEDFTGTADWATMRAVRLDEAMKREIQRIVPRGTFAHFVREGVRGQGSGKQGTEGHGPEGERPEGQSSRRASVSLTANPLDTPGRELGSTPRSRRASVSLTANPLDTPGRELGSTPGSRRASVSLTVNPFPLIPSRDKPASITLIDCSTWNIIGN